MAVLTESSPSKEELAPADEQAAAKEDGQVTVPAKGEATKAVEKKKDKKQKKKKAPKAAREPLAPWKTALVLGGVPIGVFILLLLVTGDSAFFVFIAVFAVVTALGVFEELVVKPSQQKRQNQNPVVAQATVPTTPQFKKKAAGKGWGWGKGKKDDGQEAKTKKTAPATQPTPAASDKGDSPSLDSNEIDFEVDEGSEADEGSQASEDFEFDEDFEVNLEE